MSLKYTIEQHVLLENYHVMDNVIHYLSNSPIHRYRKVAVRIRECKKSFDLDRYITTGNRKGHVACRHRLCPSTDALAAVVVLG